MPELTPEIQAALAGLGVSVLIYIARLVRPDWFSSTENAAKAERMCVSLVATLLSVAALQQASGGAIDISVLVWQWLVAFALSQSAHNIAKRLPTD